MKGEMQTAKLLIIRGKPPTFSKELTFSGEAKNERKPSAFSIQALSGRRFASAHDFIRAAALLCSAARSGGWRMPASFGSEDWGRIWDPGGGARG